MKQFFKAFTYELICAGILAAYFFPLLYPQTARFLIHDNLDGLVPLYRFVGNPAVFFADRQQMISGLMGALPREVLPSPFSFFRFLFVCFESETAYSLHYVFQHLAAFWGMRLLLREVFAKGHPAVYNIVALAFAMLPFWPGGELTVAGLPFLCWSLIRVWKNESGFIHWVIFALFPFFSALPFGNMFSFPLLFLGYLSGVFYFKSWRFSWAGLLPFVLLGLFTVVSEYGMFRLLLSGFQSNRIDDPGTHVMLNFKGMAGVSILAFGLGHYHFHSLHLPLVFLSVLIVLDSLIQKNTHRTKISIAFAALLFLLCFLTIALNNVVLLEGFHFSVRFWVLLPMLWYVYFAWMLLQIRKKQVVFLLLALQTYWVMFLPYPKDYYGSAYAENVFYYSSIRPEHEEHASFASYYAISEFDSLKRRFPELLSSHVMCFGFAPAVALYNGYKTYDAYLNLYPLEKWRQFKQINAAEFKKSGLQYYSNNRAYLFADESAGENGILQPEWNIKTMKSAGVEYILSNKAIRGSFTELGRSTHYIIYKIN